MFRFVRSVIERRTFDRLVRSASLPPDVSEALLKDLAPSERAALDAIEVVRHRTESNRREVTVMDYGAGSSTDHRTAEQMEIGVTASAIIGEVCKVASKPPVWGEMLFRLVRYQRPTSCVEMGTCMGISASYIATALKMNGQGRLVTLEGASAYAEVARANLEELGLANTTVEVGRFSETFLRTLQAMKPVEFLFVDGHHDRDATLSYLDQSRPYLARRNTLIFDDINWSDGMREAWARIRSCTTAFGLGKVGVCFDVTQE